MYRLILLTCFLAIPVFANAQQQTITLEEAIQIALENNYQLKQAENNRGLADTQVRSARADFYPNLNANFSGQRTVGRQFVEEDASFDDRTTYSLSGSMSSNVTIFNGFSNIANLRRAEADRASEELQLERLRENVMFETASRYLQVVLNQELLRISESTLEASQSQLEQIRAQVEVGARPTVDLYNQEAIVASDELSVIQDENALEVSKAQLVRIMQDDAITEVVTSMPSMDEQALMPIEMNLNELIDAALETRKDFRAQEYFIESDMQSHRIARAQFMPTISASAGINTRYSDQISFMDDPVDFGDQFFNQNINRSIGFNISIPIFTRWNTRTSVENAYVQLRNSQLELDNVRFQVSEEVRQAYNDYMSLIKELESSEKALIAAERAYETEQQRYEVGATTLIELNQANANFVQAQSNDIQAKYNFIFQEKLLDYYIGRLSETIEL
jgi:outer membrane protein